MAAVGMVGLKTMIYVEDSKPKLWKKKEWTVQQHWTWLEGRPLIKVGFSSQIFPFTGCEIRLVVPGGRGPPLQTSSFRNDREDSSLELFATAGG